MVLQPKAYSTKVTSLFLYKIYTYIKKSSVYINWNRYLRHEMALHVYVVFVCYANNKSTSKRVQLIPQFYFLFIKTMNRTYFRFDDINKMPKRVICVDRGRYNLVNNSVTAIYQYLRYIYIYNKHWYMWGSWAKLNNHWVYWYV